jgi:AcrR family transcriptional regulator
MDTRERLLEAGGQVFAEVGYQAATVRSICQLADANVALIHYHFKDKKGLYHAVLEQLMLDKAPVEQVRTAFDSARPPEEILAEVIRIRIHHALKADRPGWQARILFRELAHPSPAFTRLRAHQFLPIHQKLRELVGRIAGRSADDEETLLCVNSIVGQVMFYVLAFPHFDTPLSAERIARHITEFSLAYLR